MTLEPPSEEEDTVVESDSDSDGAPADLFKQQDFDHQIGQRENSDGALADLTKQQDFDDQIGKRKTRENSGGAPADLFKQQIRHQRKLVPARDPIRRGCTLVLNQNNLDVKMSQEERDIVKEGANLPVKRKTSQKCQKPKEAKENNFKGFPNSSKNPAPIQNAQHQCREGTRRRRSSIDDNCDLEATVEVKRILEELESIKQRISQIEHGILNRIV